MLVSCSPESLNPSNSFFVKSSLPEPLSSFLSLYILFYCSGLSWIIPYSSLNISADHILRVKLSDFSRFPTSGIIFRSPLKQNSAVFHPSLVLDLWIVLTPQT